MIALKRYRTKFWGHECLCRPMLLSEVFGDGKEWIWFGYLDDRPNYYVIRVPTRTHQLIDDQSDEWYDGLLVSIHNQIDKEAMDFYSERNWRERDRLGYVYNARRWPIPPYQPSGCAWGEIAPIKELSARKHLKRL